MCRDVITMTAIITTCPSVIATAAVSAAGWRKISASGRNCPSGAEEG